MPDNSNLLANVAPPDARQPESGYAQRRVQKIEVQAIATISHLIYQTLVSIQQQHPEWLTQKYRNSPWGKPKFEYALTDKLTKGLSQLDDGKALLKKVKNYLQILLIPEFVNSSEYKALIAEINRLIPPQKGVISTPNLISFQIPELSKNGAALTEKGIAILLLDVENLQLDVPTEKFLEKVGTNPIQIKVAFANWRSMGKKDVELHQRGYQLIHVPPGKDSADLKMATLGASIFVNYPTTKEVFVCSSDRGMTHLGNTLQSHGLTVYQVRKHQNQITVVNSKTGEEEIHAVVSPPEIPSIDRFILQLKELLIAEIEKSRIQWIKVSKILALYKETHNLTMRKVIATHFPDTRFPDGLEREFFIKNTANFAVHKPSEKSPYYVTVFDLNPSKNIEKKERQLTTIVSDINSREKMEQVLVKIMEDLTSKSPGSYIPISNLGSEFHRIYGKPITKAIQQFQPSSKFPKFLQLCSSIEVQKNEEGRWFASLEAENLGDRLNSTAKKSME